MTDLRTQYLAAAPTALDLIAHPHVATTWTEPSALEGFTVGGLTAHLAQQFTSVTAALDAAPSGKDIVGLYEHYDRAAWLAASLDNDYNTSIRDGGHTAAEKGPEAVHTEAAKALEILTEQLPTRPGDSISGNPRWPYATTLDDFLATRIMEFVVHADDLACSVSLDTPKFDQDAFDTAAAILARLAAKRHGQAALVRSLARAERAPAVISGL